MLRLIGILIISFGMVFSGKEWGKRKKQCVRELESFGRMLLYLEQEIGYCQTAMPYALERITPYTNGIAALLTQAIRVRLDEGNDLFAEIWEKEGNICYQNLGLTKEEMHVILHAGEAFGLPRKEMICAQTQIDQRYIREYLCQRKETLASDCRMSASLSFMAGLFVFFLLI